LEENKTCVGVLIHDIVPTNLLNQDFFNRIL